MSKRAKVQEIRWLSVLLCCSLPMGWLAHYRLPTYFGPSEYGTPILEFFSTHRISSVFSSLGYPFLVGLVGVTLHNAAAGLAATNLTIYLAFVAIVFTLLRQLGASLRQAFVTGLCFALYPDIVTTINDVGHNTLTIVLILSFVSCALYLLRVRVPWRVDVLMTLLLGVAIVCRSNLAIFLPLTWFLMWRYKLPHVMARAGTQLVGAAVIYCGLTVAAHGSLFWPQVGSYVLFSGANEYTEADMLSRYNDAGEGSLVPALKLRGIDAYHDWKVPDNLPGDNEIRNPKFAKFYAHEGLLFIRTHPGTMVTLTAVKLLDFVRPNLLLHGLFSVAGIVRVAEALGVWVWIALCFAIRGRPGDPSRFLIGCTVVVYALPHLLTVTAPRFRAPVDILCYVASAAMVLAWWDARQAERVVV